MDPLLLGALATVAAACARICFQWVTGRTAVRLAQLDQQGLSDRVQVLPPGSRMTERCSGREIVVEVGMSKAEETRHG
ncbi:hypothetical protein [Streptomyces wuyuanensis]|uniref:hypothetical protein n=1 Tax=Streptomyces wuyuanensis TaxID=1196353 RepID=UPI003D74CB9E